MKYFLYIFLNLIFSLNLNLFASNIDGQTVTFTKFIEEMINAKEKTTFENVKIRYMFDTDKYGMDKRFNEGGPELIVKSDIRLLNCDFDLDYWLVARNITFLEYFAVFNCTPIKAIFKGCIFKKTFRMYGSNVDFIDFDTCTFEHGFKFVRNSLKDRLKFNTCKFLVNENLIYDSDALDMEARLFLFSNKLDDIDITIEDSEFSLPDKFKYDPQYFIKLNASNFSNIRFINNKVNASIDLSQSNVSNMFMTYGCSFNEKIIMDAFNLNPVNARVQWSTVKGYKISVVNNKTNKIFNGENPDSLRDEFLFNSLVSCYSTFYGAFKTQGNRFSANACYVEWKDLETHYLKNTYNLSNDRNIFFNYLMNIFLKTFCDYGTNPLKAIIMTFYVLLSFALVYFFFPYRIKTFQRRTLYNQLKLYGHYLSSPKSLLELEDSIMAKHKEPQSYREYIKFLESTDKKLPWYFDLFGRPFYYMERLKDKPAKLIYKIIDLFPDEWETLNPFKKFIASLIYGLVFLVTVLLFLLIHALDSIMLSLNVFSTLGFGQIPIKGIPRYLTVIEGFIGWFLLSIFSVSLISQVIQ